jgi:hypothetical protein
MADAKEDIFDNTYELTDEHFELFKEEFIYWTKIFGLVGWEFHFVFDEKTSEDARAQIFRDHDSRITIVMLATKWQGSEPTEFNISKCAYHEAAELLLSKMNDLIRSRSVSDRQIEEETHNLIRILENTQWEIDFMRRKNEKPTRKNRSTARKRK